MNRLLRALTVAAVAALSITQANAQGAVLQGGPWQPGHVPMYVGQGSGQAIVQDGGGASGGSVGATLSELGITARGVGSPPYAGVGSGPLGTNICDYDAPINSATGYHYLCFSANAQGGGLLAYGAAGAATPLPLNVYINGVLTPFGSGGGGGGVSSVSVATANGFSGTVVNPTTTPQISISTSVNGILQGNGTAVAAASTTGNGSVVLGIGPTIAGETVSGTANFTGTFQYGGNAITFPGSAATLAYLGNTWASGQCVQTSGVSGALVTTGSACGAGGGGTSPGGANTNVQFNSSSTFGGNAGFTYDAVGQISLGTSGANVGSVKMLNATSGSLVIQPSTGALGTSVLTAPIGTSTIATTSLPQTLTNKTITGAAISSSTVDSTPIGSLGGLASIAGTTLSANGHVGFSGLQTTPTGSIGSALCLDTSNNVIKNASVNCFAGGGGSSAGNNGPYYSATVASTGPGTDGTACAMRAGASSSANGTALNLCIAANMAVSIPAGRYLMCGAQITANGQAIVGAGIAGTTLVCDSSTGDMITIGNNANLFTIQGLWLDRCPTTACSSFVVSTSGAGIGYTGATAGCNLCIIRDVLSENQYNGFALPPGASGLLENLTAQNNYNHGFYFTSNSVFTGNQYTSFNLLSQLNNGFGYYTDTGGLTNTYTTWMIGNAISTYLNGQGGLYFVGTNNSSINDVQINGGFLSNDNNNLLAFVNTKSEHQIIRGMLMEGGGRCAAGLCGRNAAAVSPSNNGSAVYISDPNGQEYVIQNNVMLGNAAFGVFVGSGLGAIVIEANAIKGNATNVSAYGIQITGTTTTAVVSNNMGIGAGNEVYGLYTASGATTIISGNAFGGTTAGCFISGGTPKGAGTNIGVSCP